MCLSVDQVTPKTTSTAEKDGRTESEPTKTESEGHLAHPSEPGGSKWQTMIIPPEQNLGQHFEFTIKPQSNVARSWRSLETVPSSVDSIISREDQRRNLLETHGQPQSETQIDDKTKISFTVVYKIVMEHLDQTETEFTRFNKRLNELERTHEKIRKRITDLSIAEHNE